MGEEQGIAGGIADRLRELAGMAKTEGKPEAPAKPEGKAGDKAEAPGGEGIAGKWKASRLREMVQNLKGGGSGGKEGEGWRWESLVPSLPGSAHLPAFGLPQLPAMPSSMLAALPALPPLPTTPAEASKLAVDAADWLRNNPQQAAAAAAAACTLLVLLLTALHFRREAKARKQRKPTLMELLEGDRDLSIFHKYWMQLGDSGPWDRPNLGAPAVPEPMVLFAPTNEALQSIAGQRMIMSVDEQGWRKLLTSHCAYSALPGGDLAQRPSCVSCTGDVLPLDCLRDTFSDGSAKLLQPLVASNGLLFKIPVVIKPHKQ